MIRSGRNKSISPRDRTVKAPLHDRCSKCHNFTIMWFASDMCIKCAEAEDLDIHIRENLGLRHGTQGNSMTYTLHLNSLDKNYK